MFTRIWHYYHQAKWIGWVFDIIGLVLGTYLIVGAYTFLQGIPGHPSGMLVIISGLLFLFCGVISILYRLIAARSMAPKIIGALFAISGLVLFLIA